MNSNIVPEHKYDGAVSPTVVIAIALPLFMIGLIVLIICRVYWDMWGKWAVITIVGIALLLGLLKLLERIDRHLLHRGSMKRHHKALDQHRDLATLALAQGYSVEFEHSTPLETRKLILTSPLTIPNGPVTIKELNMGEEKSGVPQIALPLTLPDKLLLVDVMKKWNLSTNHLFLALAKGSKEITCTLEGLMHVAHDAPTGGGKTAQWLAEIVQLLKLDVQVILCNPHFAPLGKKGEDWRPIGRVIEAQGLLEVAPGLQVPGLLRQHENIANMLKWLSQVEIDRRFSLQAQADYSYKPLYIFIDEWPSVVRRHPEAAEHLVDVLQRGRAVEVCVDTNAQGFLQDDVELKGSARENFNTAYHMGGSVFSGAKLLDLPVKDMNALLKNEQVTLGKGIALLRNNESCPQAELVRLPYAENMYTYYMLGRADNWVLPEFRKQTVTGNLSQDFERSMKSDEESIQGNLSKFQNAMQFEHKASVPAEIRNEIIRLRKKGFNRTEIRDAMDLNGPDYWMVKQVLDEEGL